MSKIPGIACLRISAMCVLAALLGIVAAPSARAADAPLTVVTQQGPIQGSFVAGLRRFAGVRYAAPPTGKLRWMPPAPAPVHSQVVSATHFGSQCPQADGAYTTPDEGGSEDCLYLNVFTPKSLPATPVPVMLYIHGGSFVDGSGALYPPNSMVSQTGVIVVTINYRLGLLGGLALPQLTAQSPQTGSGDYALLDQQAALAWVRANIAAFGGDPSRVTVWGESAGASYTCENVASPSAAGLFSGAIAESGCNIPGVPQTSAYAFGTAVATALNCAPNGTPDPACLRRQTPLAITNAAIAVAGNIPQSEFNSAPTIGTPTLPTTVLSAFQSGNFNRVPLLLGSNLDEGRLFVYGNDAGPIPYTFGAYRSDITTYVTPNTGAPESAVYRNYPPLQDILIPETYSAVVGDGLISCNTEYSDELASSGAGAVPVYSYEFTDPQAPNAIVIPLGPTHTSELFFLFNLPIPLLPDEQTLAHDMRAYWANFAATGNPNGTGLAPWPTFTSANNPLLNLTPGPLQSLKLSNFNTDHHCNFWQPYLAPQL